MPMCSVVSQHISVVYLHRIKWRKLLPPAPSLSTILRDVTSQRPVLLTLSLNTRTVKEKPLNVMVKFAFRTGHEGSTLSLTLVIDGMGGQRHAPAALPPGKTRYPL